MVHLQARGLCLHPYCCPQWGWGWEGVQHQIPQCQQPRARGGMGGPPVTLVGMPHQVLLGPLYWLLPCVPTKTWLLTGPDGMDLRHSQEGDWVPAIPELVAKPGWSLIAHGPLKKSQCSVPGCCQQASAEFSRPGCGRPPTKASHTAQQQGPRCRAQREAAKSICRGGAVRSLFVFVPPHSILHYSLGTFPADFCF